MRIKILAIAGALACAGAATTVRAEDWPQWRGPRLDGISRETGLLQKWPQGGLKEVWSKQVGEGYSGYSSPIAKDGKVYLFASAGANDSLMAFDAKNGDPLWAQTYPTSYTKLPAGFEGARATPTIDGSRIYTYGQGADLAAWNLADGKPAWRLNVLEQTGQKQIVEWGAASSPLIVGERLYVQSAGTNGPVVVAVNKGSGKIAWQSEARGKSGYAMCVLADKQLVAFGGTAVWGIDPQSGKTLWQEAWQTQYDVNAAMPIYRDGKLFVSSDYNNGRCAMFDLSSGKAKKLWEKRDITCRFQPPILDGNALYANSEGELKCMSWPDGKILWVAKKRDVNLGAGGSLVRAGDKLITLSEKGQLSFVQAGPQGYKLLDRADQFDADRIWATPLLYHGKLYAKGKDNLVCLQLTGE